MPSERRAVLEAFQKVVGQEAHVLGTYPGLIWQQLYNRLRWMERAEGEGALARVIARELATRSRAGAPAWLEALSPPAESPSLLRVLAGDTERINRVALLGAGAPARILTSTNAGVLRTYDLDGIELAAVECHDAYWSPLIGAFSRDGAAYAINGGVYSVSDGGLLRSCPLRDDVDVSCFADTDLVVSANADEGIVLWSLGDGCAVHALRNIHAQLESHVLATGKLTSRDLKSLGTNAIGHPNSCRMSPDGTRVVIGCYEGMAVLWYPGSGAEPLILDAGRTDLGWVRAAAFSPDGRYLLLGSDALSLWDTTSLDDGPTTVDSGTVRSCVFSADGARIAWGRDDGTVSVSPFPPRAPAARLPAHTDAVVDIAVSADSRLLVTGSWDGTVKVWDMAALASGTLPAGEPETHKSEVRDCAVSAEGTVIATVSDDGELKTWNTVGAPRSSCVVGCSSPYAVAIEANLIAVGGGSVGDIELRDADSLAVRKRSLPIATLEGVHSLRFSPGAGRLISGHWSGRCRVLSVPDLGVVRDFTAHSLDSPRPGSAVEAVLLPHEDLAITASRDGTAAGWDVRSGTRLWVLEGPGDPILDCASTADGDRVWTAGEDRTVRCWWPFEHRGEVVRSGPAAYVACQLSRDQGTLLVADESGQIELVRAQDCTSIARVAVRAGVSCASIAPDGQTIACGDRGERFGCSVWWVATRGLRTSSRISRTSRGEGAPMDRGGSSVSLNADGWASLSARQRFDTRFRRTRVVLPVIHAATESQVLANAEIARRADADGVFLINHLGSCDELSSMYAAARAHHSEWWIGINCLDLTPLELLAQVGEGVDGVWADNADVDERRDTQPDAEAARRAANDRGWPGLYFGGVAFKYQRPVADLERAARLSRDYMDVITTSGPGTGEAAEPAKIAAIRTGAGDHPLALASGVTPENVDRYLPWVDAYLVATGISRDFEHLDPGRTRALVDRVHDRP